MADQTSDDDEIPQAGKVVVYGSVAALAVVALLGVWFVFQFVADERQRGLHAWQVRLNIIADTRVAAINDWVDAQFSTMRELAENESLQIYMSEIAEVLAGEGDADAVAAEVGYLRNLLVVMAQRNGFHSVVEEPDVDANIERAGVGDVPISVEIRGAGVAG